MREERNLKTPSKELEVKKEKIKWRSNPVDGYNYTFLFSDNTKGLAELIYASVDDWKTGTSTQEFVEALYKAGLKEGDILAHLNQFLPNGRGLQAHEVEEVRWSQVLNFLTQEVVDRKAKAIYVFGSSPAVGSFLESHGFVMPDNWRHYKIIT